jgi:quercetin dioxygenase-like cupin family protein
VAVVNFSPGAVNVFHTHTFNQILYVTEGTRRHERRSVFTYCHNATGRD